MDAKWSQTHAHICRGLDGLGSVLFLEMLVYPSNSPKAMSPISKRKKKKKEASLSPFYCVVRVGSGLLGKCQISNMKCLEVHSLSFPKIDISQDKKENCFFT